MQARTAWTLAACLMGSTMLGCSTGPGTIRAQSPSDGLVEHGTVTPAVAYSDQLDPRYQPVSMSYQDYGQGTYPANGYCGPECENQCDDGCHGCQNCRKDWYPTHYHNFTYSIPWNNLWAISPSQLSYPPQNQPAGVVQYPYYTVRGPTDFFFE